MWWIVVGNSVLSLVEMEAVNFYRRESVALKVSGRLFKRESPAALVVEWTALRKRVDSGSVGEWKSLFQLRSVDDSSGGS